MMPKPHPRPATILAAGIAYFALVFGAGFVLGSVRVPFLVPRLGERIAELIETPFMLAVIVLAARFVARRFALPRQTAIRLGVGIVALALLLAAELAFIAVLLRRSVGEYIASRDPVAGTVFLAMLLVYALMPLLLARLESVRTRDVN